MKIIVFSSRSTSRCIDGLSNNCLKWKRRGWLWRSFAGNASVVVITSISKRLSIEQKRNELVEKNEEMERADLQANIGERKQIISLLQVFTKKAGVSLVVCERYIFFEGGQSARKVGFYIRAIFQTNFYVPQEGSFFMQKCNVCISLIQHPFVFMTTPNMLEVLMRSFHSLSYWAHKVLCNRCSWVAHALWNPSFNHSLKISAVSP